MPVTGGYGYGGGYVYVAPNQIVFHDNVQSNAQAAVDPATLQFLTATGETVDLESFQRGKNLVLVFTRGGVEPPCVYCSTHTSRLIAQYDAIAQRDAEVLVVFPLASAADHRRYAAFTAALQREIQGNGTQRPIPFPVVIDPDLKAINQLNLRGDLAKPATFILDKDARVRFAYVGQHAADRPSVQAILQQLDALRGAGAP